MLRLTDLRLPLEHTDDDVRRAALARMAVPDEQLTFWRVARRGYDARRRGAITFNYAVDAALTDEAGWLAGNRLARGVGLSPDESYRFVARASATRGGLRPVVIGAGPCGLMAALLLAQMGFRPLVLERGRVVRERTRDTWGLWRRGVLDPASNAQYGEGGAGTFSDGKLWSGIKDDAFRRRKLLEEFVRAGAPDEILFVSKPHIGTFRLVSMVERIRGEIERLGGAYRFGARVAGLDVATMPDGARVLRGLVLADGERIAATHAVLAIGHSARDTVAMLHAAGVAMAAKPFAIGVRIEHPQAMIDRARFGEAAGDRRLGAADYKLVHHDARARSAYSFCMCPGGTVVAAASEPGGVVTNGMSQYSRAERNANAGLVVGVEPSDVGVGGPLAGIDFQRRWEQAAYAAGGGGYIAPAQRVDDFLAGRASTALGDVLPSYRPGVRPADLAACLPDFVTAGLRAALPALDRKLPGFARGDAVMTGVETRTSSPVRLPRDGAFQSPGLTGVYPAGEGAGYAGGIMSAGVDGIRVAEAVALSLIGALASAGAEAA